MIVLMDRRDVSQRKKRIGRKTIATVRLAVSIERKLDSGPKKSRFQIRYEFRKWHLYVAVAVIALAILGIFIFNIVNAQITTQRQAEQARQQKIDEQKAKDRDVCRSKILIQRSNQVGKLTYDQLYGSQCN